MSLFANDCVLYMAGNNWLSVQRKKQSDFDEVIAWTFRNNLRLNPGKTKAMNFGSSNRLAELDYSEHFNACGHNIVYVKQHMYLGIVFDSTMSLGPLTKDIKKRVTNKIFMLRKLRKYLTFESAVTVYKQTILPIIDYAIFLMIACTKEMKNDFQNLQNDILIICTMTCLADRVKKLHEKCKIISLEQRMRKQLLWLMYILSRDHVFLQVPNRVTRNALKITFKVPNKITPVYEKSPFYIGTKLWNELSVETQDSTDIFEFKKHIARMNRRYKKL